MPGLQRGPARRPSPALRIQSSRGIVNYRLRGIKFHSVQFHDFNSTISIVELLIDLRGVKMVVCGIVFVDVELCEMVLSLCGIKLEVVE